MVRTCVTWDVLLVLLNPPQDLTSCRAGARPGHPISGLTHRTKTGSLHLAISALRSVLFVYAAAEEQVLQHHGVVMGLIMGREHECDPAVLRQRTQPIELVRMLPNLRLVAAPEFLPPRGIMSEPLAQSVAGRDVFHPFIDGGIGLFHSSRPQPVDQDSSAVIGRGRFIGSLELDVVRCNLLAHPRSFGMPSRRGGRAA